MEISREETERLAREAREFASEFGEGLSSSEESRDEVPVIRTRLRSSGHRPSISWTDEADSISTPIRDNITLTTNDDYEYDVHIIESSGIRISSPSEHYINPYSFRPLTVQDVTNQILQSRLELLRSKNIEVSEKLIVNDGNSLNSYYSAYLHTRFGNAVPTEETTEYTVTYKVVINGKSFSYNLPWKFFNREGADQFEISDEERMLLITDELVNKIISDKQRDDEEAEITRKKYKESSNIKKIGISDYQYQWYNSPDYTIWTGREGLRLFDDAVRSITQDRNEGQGNTQ